MIGIFDSGVGGMTVARAIEQFCPGYPLIYFGDLARMPYGPKSPAMITEYAHRNTEFLLRQGARLIVIACNSAASVASALLRSHYAERIIDVIDPAVARAAAVSGDFRGASRRAVVWRDTPVLQAARKRSPQAHWCGSICSRNFSGESLASSSLGSWRQMLASARGCT